METREWRTVDKSAWGEGPWQHEPDKRQWEDPATGLPCLIVRNRAGALCGYVGVGRWHWCYGQAYDVPPVEVHGGLTFAERCQPGPEDASICHVVGPGEDDDVWWFGFDCAHAFDFMPAMYARRPEWITPADEYRELAYVENEVASLARQLITPQRWAANDAEPA